MELYKKYRPEKIEELVGQHKIIGQLVKYQKEPEKIPHTILLCGPSGCGKTTIARMIAKFLKCSKHDFTEINCADFRGIEFVRSIRTQMKTYPMKGNFKVYLIDEVHKLTSDAQEAFLKLWEDTPDHVYFILATTDPAKLKKTVLTRCTEIKVQLLNDKDMRRLVSQIAEGESDGAAMHEEVLDAVVEAAEGSARKALVILEQVLNCDTEEEQLKAVSASAHKEEAINLARTLFNPRATFADAAKILANLEDEPENVRYLVLGYANSILLKGGALTKKAAKIIEIFSFNTYDSKKAGLSLYCYQSFE